MLDHRIPALAHPASAGEFPLTQSWDIRRSLILCIAAPSACDSSSPCLRVADRLPAVDELISGGLKRYWQRLGLGVLFYPPDHLFRFLVGAANGCDSCLLRVCELY